jgi:hypothetical protein
VARPKHTIKELEAVLKEAEGKGWRVWLGGRYWNMYCPYECKCMKTVKCTPSDPNYLRNLRGHLERATCWRKS